MRRKRRKTNFDDVKIAEEEQKKCTKTVAAFQESNVEPTEGEAEGEVDTVISCAQVSERPNQSNNLNLENLRENKEGYASDEDLFGDIPSPHSIQGEEMPSSPVLVSFMSPIRARNKSALKCTISIDWGGDDTLILKCTEELEKQEPNKPNKEISVFRKENEENSILNFSRQQNDSVFGDIDLSYIENQIVAGKCVDTAKNNVANVKTDATSPIGATTVKSNASKCMESPISAAVVDQFSGRSSKPIAASTPARTPGPRKGLMNKITERLKANANQQTTTSFHLNDVGKVFPELLMDMTCSSQVFSQSVLHPKSLGPYYGLPMRVKELMQSIRGIKKFYDWQDKCLTLPSVLRGKNLIYSLPTSGGKTLVAEMLIMKELLCKEKDAVLVLPFVAIVQEKVRSIAQFADELDFLVEEYAGSKGKIPPTKRRKRKSLYICTIEKANSLVNSLIEAGRIDSIGLLVVDELHMLGEGGRRGATIEMMLAKIMHVATSTQIIGMSATLSNIQDLASFLQAEVYTNDFRPVALDEHVKYGDSIYKVDNKKLNRDERLDFVRAIDFKSKEMASKDTDHLATLVLEVIPDHSCLIFCPTKKNCENVATMICKLLPEKLKERKTKEKMAILETLYQDSGGVGVCPVLSRTLPYGVAYHHSGLTSDERRLIEEAYTDGVLCVITCTSTLAAGVNLPARRVIIRSPYVGRDFLSRSHYKQMVGRAGRAGIDTKGESFLILTKPQDKEKVLELVTGPVETCISSLMYDGGKGFKTLILNLINLKIMAKLSDVTSFFTRTLLSVQLDTLPDKFSYLASGKVENTSLDGKALVETVTKNALQKLLELKLIKLIKIIEDGNTTEPNDFSDCKLEVTKLGVATNRGSIDFAISSIVYEDLKIGLQSLVLVNYLHLLYLVTPHDAAANIKPNWMIYFQEYGNLTSDEQRAATIIGVPENYVAMKAAGHRVRNKKFKDEVVSRFYVTLMLYHLFRGRSVWNVSAKFEQPRGFLQTLLSSSAAFASCVLHFTKEIEEFWPYHGLLEKLIKNLQYCTTSELLPLMEIPGVKIARAKQLYNAGFKTLAQIAKTDVSKLIKSIEHLSRRQALQLKASAKVLLKEKIEELQAEAEELQMVP